MQTLFGGIYKNKKVLITGHTGFKGSWLSILLNELGADVYGYALNPPTNPSLYEEAHINDIVNSSIGDVRDFVALKKVIVSIQPDIIFHMAAQSLVRKSYDFPVDTFSVNIMGTVNLLEAIRDVSAVKALVNITTDKCYENKEWCWGYRENDQLGGYDPYSSSKACSEIVTSAYRRSFFENETQTEVAVATARAGNVIGGGDWAEDRLIPDFVRAISNKHKIVLRNPSSIRPWQHVLEPLSGYLTLGWKLLEKGNLYSGSWNFGPKNSDAQTVEWIIKKMLEFSNSDIGYEVSAIPQVHEATYLKLDCSKAHDVLNWTPRWDMEKSLKSIVNFMMSREKGLNLRSVCVNQIQEYFFNN